MLIREGRHVWDIRIVLNWVIMFDELIKIINEMNCYFKIENGFDNEMD